MACNRKPHSMPDMLPAYAVVALSATSADNSAALMLVRIDGPAPGCSTVLQTTQVIATPSTSMSTCHNLNKHIEK